VIGIEDGFEGLILPDKARPLSLADVGGILLRGGSPSAFDRLLASRFGAFAVRFVSEGQFDHMVALRGQRLVAVRLAEATGRQKCAPRTVFRVSWPVQTFKSSDCLAVRGSINGVLQRRANVVSTR